MNLTLSSPRNYRPLGLGFLVGGQVAPVNTQSDMPVVDPLAAHVAAMQGINGTGGYFLADPSHYNASLTQAGVFTDAFGGSRTYAAPNVQASPTAVQDPTSGLWYVSSDGADDTAIGNAVETVAAYTCLFRSPRSSWSGYGPPLDSTGASWAGILESGNSTFRTSGNGSPRAVRKNGALTTGFNLAPITSWMVVTVYCANSTQSVVMQMFDMANNSGFANRLHLAALRTWPTDPTASVVQQTEQEMTRFFSPLLATNP